MSSAERLLAAADRGDIEVVTSLLDAGVMPDGVDEDNETPLHKACFKGHLAVVKFLLDSFPQGE